MAVSDSNGTTIQGSIAARVDRLPLTRVQWHLAILVEITWGFIIVDTDGIGARRQRGNHSVEKHRNMSHRLGRRGRIGACCRRRRI